MVVHQRQLIIVAAISLIIISMVFIILMAPFQAPRTDAPWLLWYMSAYTAWGRLGVISGSYLLYSVIRGI